MRPEHLAEIPDERRGAVARGQSRSWRKFRETAMGGIPPYNRELNPKGTQKFKVNVSADRREDRGKWIRKIFPPATTSPGIFLTSPDGFRWALITRASGSAPVSTFH